eukprot:COSAG02_NODE_14429_length_1273_cov_3.115843_3_plen_92_part_00
MRDVMKALRTRYPNEYNQCSKAWLREVVDEIVATRNVYPDDSPPSLEWARRRQSLPMCVDANGEVTSTLICDRADATPTRAVADVPNHVVP